MKCLYGESAHRLCLSNECSEHPLFCGNKLCRCHDSHSQRHRNLSIQDMKKKVENKATHIRWMKETVRLCNEFISYLETQITRIETYIEDNPVENSLESQQSDLGQMDKRTLQALIKISEENIPQNINVKVMSNIPHLFENVKSHLRGVWEVIEVKRSPNELFSRFNRKIQGKKNIMYLHLNHVNIVPVPSTFDYTKLTGIRITVIDLRTIQLLSLYTKSLRRLQIYQQNTVKNKHVLEIARVLNRLVHLNLHIQNVSDTAVLKIAANLTLLKGFTLYGNSGTDNRLKNRFKKIRPSCTKLAM